jgi:hypothetical protein
MDLWALAVSYRDDCPAVPPIIRNYGPVPVLPAAELIENLLRAYSPCPAFQHECALVKWGPEEGFVPRGFLGATGSIHEVRLVLLTAGPGDPLPAETYHGSQPRCSSRHITSITTL